jgi:hypothetical protein
MYKSFIIGALVCVMAAIIFLASDMKSAYKILPGPTSPIMPQPAPFIEWLEFEPPSKAFKAQLPAVPQSAKQAVDVPNTNKKRRYEMFASEKMDGSLFMVNLITYPTDFNTTNKEEILHSVVEELMQGNPANRLSKVEASSFQDHQALTFDIENKEFDVQGKAFMVDKIVYLLVYVTHQGNFSEADFKHFLNSFEIGSLESNKH